MDKKHYFVDEAGDPSLFASSGKVLIGEEGCSRFFILGLIDAREPDKLRADLYELRARLLADPYFRNVPSMQPEERKTALLFHAKDDLPEVRREVFQLLQRQAVRFSAVACDKRRVLSYVRRCNETDPQYRYRPNDLYDYLVRRLFKQRLHKHGFFRICFARRGNSDRTYALAHALETARQNFEAERGIEVDPFIEVVPISSARDACLQAADYFLWALQRTFERHEDRFLQLLWPQCSLIVDADDTREKGYGTYYTKKKPLTAAALREAEGYRSESPR